MAAADDVDVHPLLLVGVYLERVFALASEYWTHNLLLLRAKLQNFPQTISIPLEKLTNRHEKGREIYRNT